MKLSDHVYHLTGKSFDINSNIYAIHTQKGIVIIDSGYADKQFQRVQDSLNYWGFSMDDVTDVILTHCHFDHVGNAHKFRALGKRILMGEKDAPAVETGNAFVIEDLFGTPYTPCKIDVKLKAGDVLDYGDVKLTVIDQEGHTRGAIALLLESETEKILFAGDLFEIATVTPAEERILNLAWMDGQDFNGEKYLETIRDIYDMDVQIICVGHGPVYYADSREILHQVYEQACAVLKKS